MYTLRPISYTGPPPPRFPCKVDEGLSLTLEDLYSEGTFQHSASRDLELFTLDSFLCPLLIHPSTHSFTHSEIHPSIYPEAFPKHLL